MSAVIKPITALLISAAIILAANGLDGVLLPLRGSIEGFTALELGLLGAFYYGGFTLGCLIGPRIIARVGHIRAFLMFAAVATIAPLLEAMQPDPHLWWVFRGLTGVCFAGIMNVMESWLTSVATNANRGRIMSTYALVNFGALTAGQQLTNLAEPDDFRLFSLVAILCALAAVPLALTLSQSPTAPARPQFRIRELYRVSPAAVAGCLGGGLANGAFWSLSPVYARESGLEPGLIAAFVSLAVVGGALSQWPVGRISDSIDRRRVLIVLCAGASVIGLLLFLNADSSADIKLTLAAIFGVFALPVYWISSAHANDLADPEDAVNISASLLLLFGVGAIFGPILAALIKEQLGHGSIFLYTAGMHLLIALVIGYRIMQRSGSLPDEERFSYDELPVGSTPAAMEFAASDAQEDAVGPADREAKEKTDENGG